MSFTNFLLFETRSFHSNFEYFFCRTRLGIRVLESLLDSQRESALFVVPEESKFVHFQSVSLSFMDTRNCEQTTGLSVLSGLTDDDRQDDRPSSE